MDLRAVLADVAAAGPYFAVGTGPAGDAPSGEGRLTVAEVLAGPVLDERIAHVARSLSCDDRVAGSLAHQGLAALLVSPPLAAAAVHGVVPAWTPRTLYWTRSATGTWEQWCEDPPAAAAPDVPELAVLVADVVLDGLLAPLADAVRARVGVADRILRGNAASCVVAAARLVARCRPASSGRADALARLLLGSPPLAGSGAFGRGGAFRRRSCCLYYRVPGGGLCGDCVLHGGGALPASR